MTAADPHRFGAWRSMLASMAEPETRLGVFRDQCDDLAGQVGAGRLDKPSAVDELADCAGVFGLIEAFGTDEIQAAMGEAFAQAERIAPKPDAGGEGEMPTFEYVDIMRELVPRDWVVPDRIPAKNITLFSGEGAVGKSLLLLQLSAAVALGRDWLGTMPKQGPVLFLSCEEDDDEITRRLEDVAKYYRVTRADLKPLLHVVSLAGKDAILGIADRSGTIRPTRLFERLRAEARRIQPILIIADTVADVFGGDEINRAQTRRFLTLGRGLAIEANAALVLASHPSLQGIASGSGISGSTAWHNSVRSRMYLRLAEEDSDVRVLEVKKANYAKISEEISLRWRDGVYVSESDASNNEPMAPEQIDELFLDNLRRFTSHGRNVSPSRSPTYAPTVFARLQGIKAAKVKPEALAAAMERLFGAGKIRVVAEGPPSRRREHIVEVPGASNTPLPTPFQRFQHPVHTHPPIPPIPLEGGKGGVGSPPPSNGEIEEGKEDSFPVRVVGPAPAGTSCVHCHQTSGAVMRIKRAEAGAKTETLHEGCAKAWFETVSS